MQFVGALAYNNSIWTPYTLSGGTYWQPAANWGWGQIVSPNANFTTWSWTQKSCTGQPVWYDYTFYNYYDSSGVAHPIAANGNGLTLTNYPSSGANCPGGDSNLWYDTVALPDGSGYTLYFNTTTQGAGAKVYAASGDWSLVYPQGAALSGTIYDPNGNQESWDSTAGTYTDSLGITALSTNSGSNTVTYTYTGPNNTQANVTVWYTQMNVGINFGCPGNNGYWMQPYLPTSITLPDGPSNVYTFTYEPTPGLPGYTTGRLASVTLPSGGTISYTYSGGPNGITCADGTTPTLKRTLDPGNGATKQVWTYQHTENTSTTWSTTVTDSTSAANVTNFSFVIGSNGNAYETERTIYQGSSTLMETVDTCYGASIPCVTTPITAPISNQTVQVTLPGLSPAKTYTKYNPNGLPTEVDEYTYGPTLVRQTLTTYDTALNSSYIYDRPQQVQVVDSGGTRAQTTYTYDGNGNLKTETRSTSGSATISRSFSYGLNGAAPGVLNSATDFDGHTTSYSNFQCNGAFPGTITAPNNLTTNENWDCNGGVITSVTDPNNETTTYSYDSLWRLIETQYPDGGNVSTAYYYQPTYTDTLTALNSSTNREDIVGLDGLGRISYTELASDPQGATYVGTTYDAVGRVASITNAYRGSSPPSNSTTQYSYDPLNRLTAIVRPDGSTVATSYPAACATSTDEAGKVRTTCSDALGRISSVNEDPNGLNYQTTYTYDALNDLTAVSQSGQTRTYAYDMLGRMTSATTPEANYNTRYLSYTTSGGSVCSGDPSAVCSRIDERSITTTYAYDSLNRLTSKTYSDGTPTATLSYDQSSVNIGSWPSGTLTNTLGRLTEAVTTSGGSVQTAAVYSYDPMGRPTHYWQCTPGVCGTGSPWEASYGYDWAGDIQSWIHPAQFTITNQISAAQRITEVDSSLSDSYHPSVLAQNISYTPWGALSSLTNGCASPSGPCTKTVESYAYNNRLQPAQIQLGNNSNSSAFYSLTYNYSSQGVPQGCYITSQASGNNGNVMGYTYTDIQNGGLSHTAIYAYDSVNRLACAQATGNSTYNITFDYTHDGSSGQYGNMHCTAAAGTCNTTLAFNASTNRINTTGYGYDLAGDQTQGGGISYQYDAEQRVTGANNSGSAWTATYNALGQAVQGTWPSGPVDVLWDPNGTWLGYTGGGVWNATVNLGGRALAYVVPGAYTSFMHANALNSTTMETPYNGGTPVSDMLYYPQGQIWQDPQAQDYQFAGAFYMDWLTSADVTPNRFYRYDLGRWLTPDPAGVSAVNPSNPQTWNMYAYVTNNPTTLNDPSGLCGCGGGSAFGSGGGGGGGCGGGYGGGGGGGGGRGQPPQVLPIPGAPTVSVPGGSFPNPFTTGDQPPGPVDTIVDWLPLPPWAPTPPGTGGGGGGGGACSQFASSVVGCDVGGGGAPVGAASSPRNVASCRCTLERFGGLTRYTGCTYHCSCEDGSFGDVTFSCSFKARQAFSSCPDALTGCYTLGRERIHCDDFCN
jgi:RHS repeat-associated protein